MTTLLSDRQIVHRHTGKLPWGDSGHTYGIYHDFFLLWECLPSSIRENPPTPIIAIGFLFVWSKVPKALKQFEGLCQSTLEKGFSYYTTSQENDSYGGSHLLSFAHTTYSR
jgi:hypothetical protein